MLEFQLLAIGPPISAICQSLYIYLFILQQDENVVQSKRAIISQ